MRTPCARAENLRLRVRVVSHCSNCSLPSYVLPKTLLAAWPSPCARIISGYSGL